MDVVGTFILPPSKRSLLKDLKLEVGILKRNEKKNESSAKWGITFSEYDYVVINKNMSECVNQILNIIRSERLKRSRYLDLTIFINKFRN